MIDAPLYKINEVVQPIGRAYYFPLENNEMGEWAVCHDKMGGGLLSKWLGNNLQRMPPFGIPISGFCPPFL